MKCCFCDNGSSRVVETRKADDGSTVRRRRECGECERRFTTYERIKPSFLKVQKSDGSVESFSRDKLVEGVSRACEKRPVGDEEIEEIVDSVEASLVEDSEGIVSSERIGELVMKRLKEVDKVSYMRFASVYRSFEDVDSFKEEIEELKSG